MRQILFLVIVFCSVRADAQQLFTLRLENSTINTTPAVHSGAFGAYNNKWFFIGGRKNGLHGFLPPSAFTDAGINDSIYIVDPVANQRWSAPVSVLPDTIREAITTSNMEFYLNDTILYMVGGYGWNEVVQDFITFHTLTAVNIKELMNDVISAQPIESNFRQMRDSSLAVCGAHLAKMDSVYYLVFGHRYDGHYDRIGTLGIATQTYTCEVRKFQIADDGNTLSVYNYQAIRDTANFRRRDYNLIPMLDPFYGEGLLAYSGVFQPQSNVPYLNCVEIYPDTVIVRNDFNQNLSQYHSAVCALYDSISFLQHHLFFGGMSMYYMDTLTQQTVTDTLVPFVRTISDVARDIDWTYYEFDAGIHLPALIGTNAYFFNDLNLPLYKKHFAHLNALPHHQRLGYIVGGIESMDLNIAANNPDAQSFASTRVIEVWLDTIEAPNGMAEVKSEVLNFFAFPNPSSGKVQIEFELLQASTVKIQWLDMKGSLVKEVSATKYTAGKQNVVDDISALPKGIYNCLLTVNNQRKAVRVTKR